MSAMMKVACVRSERADSIILRLQRDWRLDGRLTACLRSPLWCPFALRVSTLKLLYWVIGSSTTELALLGSVNDLFAACYPKLS